MNAPSSTHDIMSPSPRNASKKRQEAQPDPAALREVFGQNLQLLSERYSSIAELCRKLGINRTQFNRYMTGESFPRPDVLYRICAFFDVDARILLEPVTQISQSPADLLNHPALAGFFGTSATVVEEKLFPSGFYRFARLSFLEDGRFVIGMVHVRRQDGYTFLRGFEPRRAVVEQGLSPHGYHREYRGVVLRQEEGVMAIVTHRESLACSFNFLAPETAFQSNLWGGYASRTVREKVGARRANRMVYEHLGTSFGTALKGARSTGVVSRGEVPRFFLNLLRPDDEFR
jgi:transcriptional regulator with XRE-family HTH domain